MTNSNKIQLDYVEFYITNICNFNCSGCNRFNNYNLSGNQKWKDYQSLYAQWASLVEIKSFNILGGEPMCNPSYLDWIKGLTSYWPNARSTLVTNGHYIKSTDTELYQVLKETNTTLSIGLHNKTRLENILETIKKWLHGDVIYSRYPQVSELPNIDKNWKNSYDAIRDSTWPECNTINDWSHLPDHVRDECQRIFNFSPESFGDERQGHCLIDKNKVKVIIDYENFFHQGHIFFDKTKNSFCMPLSDPIKSHEICDMKSCHHFSQGKLYKCGVVTVLPDFEKQYQIDLLTEDIELIHAYQPADPSWQYEDLTNFVDNLKNPIPQCKFCPEQYNSVEIFAESNKKLKIKKKNGK